MKRENIKFQVYLTKIDNGVYSTSKIIIEKFNAFLEKYIKLFSPEIFLKYLIEIIVSQERFLTINPYLIELIEGELKDEKAKDFKDWKHELTPSVKTQ
jgi:hypothetical protein